jgi:hypothetical protein
VGASDAGTTAEAQWLGDVPELLLLRRHLLTWLEAPPLLKGKSRRPRLPGRGGRSFYSNLRCPWCTGLTLGLAKRILVGRWNISTPLENKWKQRGAWMGVKWGQIWSCLSLPESQGLNLDFSKKPGIASLSLSLPICNVGDMKTTRLLRSKFMWVYKVLNTAPVSK